VGDVTERPANRRTRSRASGRPPASTDRIAELEAELDATQKTIAALIEQVERGRQGTPEEGRALEAVNAELRALTSNLDMIVRQRTRALAESEAQLRERIAELKRQSALKVEFMSIATHELRTPMTSIVGYLDLLIEGKFGALSDDLARPVASIRRSAHRLKQLADEMLDVSRLEEGRVALRRGPCALDEIVRDVVEENRPMAAVKRLTIAVELESPPIIDADADKIHQMASCILANAIRHTPDGGEIAILVDRAPQDRYAGAWARLSVTDSAASIPLSERRRIFEPFSDVDPAKHHTSAGPDSAGLGLFIARGLVELHGGLMTVDTKDGALTELTVLLPVLDVDRQGCPA
jgi:signal transduction histidine kinase